MYSILEKIKKHKRITGISLGVILLLCIVFPLVFSSSSGKNVYTVTKEDLVNTVLVDGTYVIASQTQITSPTNGIITHLFVTNGAYVQKGDPLFHVESSATDDEKKTAYAAYLSDSSTLKA